MTASNFGPRLRKLRLARGLSQTELGDAIGISKRMVVHWEKDGSVPPGHLLAKMAESLNVSLDELLGVSSKPERVDPKTAKVLRRVKEIVRLPPADQRAILKIIDGFIQGRRSGKAA